MYYTKADWFTCIYIEYIVLISYIIFGIIRNKTIIIVACIDVCIRYIDLVKS